MTHFAESTRRMLGIPSLKYALNKFSRPDIHWKVESVWHVFTV